MHKQFSLLVLLVVFLVTNCTKNGKNVEGVIEGLIVVKTDKTSYTLLNGEDIISIVGNEVKQATNDGAYGNEIVTIVGGNGKNHLEVIKTGVEMNPHAMFGMTSSGEEVVRVSGRSKDEMSIHKGKILGEYSNQNGKASLNPEFRIRTQAGTISIPIKNLKSFKKIEI